MYWLPIKMNSIFQALTIIILLSSCNAKKDSIDKLYIVCTTSIVADGVKNIVKDQAIVESLMGPGVDPHLYKASHGDLVKLQDADIIIYNGLFLEGKMGEILEKLSRKKSVISLGDAIDKNQLLNSSTYQGAYDPHIWFDVKLWKQALASLPPKLAAMDTLNAEPFQTNFDKYSKKLDSLDQAVALRIKEIPDNKRVLITAHDAFEYFGRAYNIEVKGLQGISTLSEPGLQDVSTLVKFIVEREIPAIYTETSVSQKSIKAVLEGSIAKGHIVEIGGSLYSDAMGESGTLEGTYIGMVDANVNKIVSGLNPKGSSQVEL